MLVVHCTAKLAKAARLKLEPAHRLDALHWLDRWYATTAPLSESSELILFTNAASLFTILVSQPTGKVTLFAAVAEFQRKLGRELRTAKMDPTERTAVAERHARYITCKTASRSVLGSMTDMALNISTHRFVPESEAEPLTVDTVQSTLNAVPLGPLGYQYPIERFHELVASECR